jgi:uncharacterized protein YlxP (DUF503 family)
MIVSRMMFELKVVEGYSMKDRRKVEKGISESLAKRFNISIVIDRDDYPVNLFTLYIAQVNKSLTELDRTYEKILQLLLSRVDIELVKTEFETLN